MYMYNILFCQLTVESMILGVSFPIFTSSTHASGVNSVDNVGHTGNKRIQNGFRNNTRLHTVR